MPHPLSGITVISLEQAIAAPLASRHLADWGARVIKVERPDGGDFARGYDSVNNGLSSQFLWVNRGKESFSIDLKTAEGREALEALLSTADVWVQNLAPGAAKRMGLDGAAVLSRHPGIVAADLSGYGSTGPYCNKKAYDLLVQCEAGFISINGTEEQPAKCGLSIVDIAGGMALLQGILMGLVQKARTGAGMHFETSLFDAIAEWMSYPAYYAIGSGSPPQRSGLRHATIAPYGPFRTGDGKTVFFGIQNQREWESFCSDVMQNELLARTPEYKDNPTRLKNQEALRLRIEERFAALTAGQAMTLLDDASIANAKLNDVDAFISHPQIVERDRFTTIESEFGPQRVLLPSLNVSGVSPVLGPVPALGQHTAYIMAEVAA